MKISLEVEHPKNLVLKAFSKYAYGSWYLSLWALLIVSSLAVASVYVLFINARSTSNSLYEMTNFIFIGGIVFTYVTYLIWTDYQRKKRLTIYEPEQAQVLLSLSETQAFKWDDISLGSICKKLDPLDKRSKEALNGLQQIVTKVVVEYCQSIGTASYESMKQERISRIKQALDAYMDKINELHTEHCQKA
ncbi:MAG: hypothetical protein OXR68_05490 [Alphaproteobacteria bacterium]|nr:hypothetical protein [Alphaproteobacteria bacterium]MDD9920057.1 hypothetical protein [Alphaproteobacteria bacterium]